MTFYSAWLFVRLTVAFALLLECLPNVTTDVPVPDKQFSEGE